MSSILKTIDITLTGDDIKQIIADKVNQELSGYDVEPDDVKLEISTRTIGYYTDEHTEHYFKGATVHCVSKNESEE